MTREKPILLAGPTASGKSLLALRLAADRPSVIVNADSMQVYTGLRILTARPSAAEEAATPHQLYGHVAPADRYSVGRWLADITETLRRAEENGLRPIIVGGTGLYFRALTEGLAEIPAIPPEVRAGLAARAKEMPTTELHAQLAVRSPIEAARLRPTDRSRILRALEVLEVTGRTLPYWQASGSVALVDPGAADRIVLMPDRAELHRRIGARFRAMVGDGALDEARAIEALGLDASLPAMKAIGLRPLLAHLRGEIGLDEAIARGEAETRQYAKRQVTWFRHQMKGWRLMPGST